MQSNRYPPYHPSTPFSLTLLALLLVTILVFLLVTVGRSTSLLGFLLILRISLLFLLRIVLLLLLSVLDLVLYQIMECCDCADQTTQVDGHQLIIRLGAHRTSQLVILRRSRFRAIDLRRGGRRRQVRQQVENILEVSKDRMVDG